MIAYERLLENTAAYRTFVRDAQEGRLSHAYLVLGEDALANAALCLMMTRAAVCFKGGCGACADCRAAERGEHPAVFRPESLNAEDLRDFLDETAYAAAADARRVFLISDLENADARVQNLLLKRLEEPNGHLFIFGATKASAILDTVKSRCRKVWTEPFSAASLEGALSDAGADDETARRAAYCSFGSLTRADAIATDAGFPEKFAAVAGVLSDMKTSKQALEMLARLSVFGRARTSDKQRLPQDGVRPERRTGEKRRAEKREAEIDLGAVLDVLEIILDALLRARTGTGTGGVFAEAEKLSATYDPATLANLSALVVECRKRLASNCRTDTVAETLLMGILEVKYKCRK